MNPLSLSARRAWIEIKSNRVKKMHPESLSARRAWIEISLWALTGGLNFVALRKESVDRNIFITLKCSLVSVALRKESVDRN